MKRVLIVDDAAFMRISIKNMLLKNGYEISGEAENGDVAVQKFTELSPDIITMDITMPEKGFIVIPFKEETLLNALNSIS